MVSSIGIAMKAWAIGLCEHVFTPMRAFELNGVSTKLKDAVLCGITPIIFFPIVKFERSLNKYKFVGVANAKF